MLPLSPAERPGLFRQVCSVAVGWLFALTILFQPGAAAAFLLNANEVEQFADAVIEPAMLQAGVPGLIIAIVDPSGVVLTKGYGVHDLSTSSSSSRPVRTDATLFNSASIGKLFTAILLAQLVDEGRLALDVDVNNYLTDLKVPGDTVTLRTLLGHRAGFDKELSYLFTGWNGVVEMSVEAINRRLVRDNGISTVSSYDNIGYGLIGLIMESVTGQPLPELFQQYIFAPLELPGATYGFPTPEGLEHAKCYVTLGVRTSPCELLQFRQPIRGAGGVALSADAGARFMQMLLNEGVLNDVRVLTPEAYQDLVNLDAYRFHPELAGLGWAFQGVPDPDRKVLGHTGSMPGFSSAMRLYPESGVGVLISFMGGQPASFDATLSYALELALQPAMPDETRAGLAALHGFAQSFADRFLPGISATPDDLQLQPRTVDVPSVVAGNYYPTGPEHRSLLLRIRHWSQAFPVAAVSQSAITFAGQGPFEQKGRLLYVDASGRKLAFQEHDGVMYMAIGTSIATLVRKSGWQAPIWSVPAGLIAILLALSSMVYLLPTARDPFRRLATFTSGGVVLALAAIAVELEFGELVRTLHGDTLWSLLWYGLLLGSAFLLLSGCVLARTAWSVTSAAQVPGNLLRFHALLIGLACLVLVGALAIAMR